MITANKKLGTLLSRSVVAEIGFLPQWQTGSATLPHVAMEYLNAISACTHWLNDGFLLGHLTHSFAGMS
jgi:hypothetical protein